MCRWVKRYPATVASNNIWGDEQLSDLLEVEDCLALYFFIVDHCALHCTCINSEGIRISAKVTSPVTSRLLRILVY